MFVDVSSFSVLSSDRSRLILAAYIMEPVGVMGSCRDGRSLFIQEK